MNRRFMQVTRTPGTASPNDYYCPHTVCWPSPVLAVKNYLVWSSIDHSPSCLHDKFFTNTRPLSDQIISDQRPCKRIILVLTHHPTETSTPPLTMTAGWSCPV